MTTIAFVGCAHIHTPDFVRRLKERDDIRVKYVWDPQIARAEKWAPDLKARAIPELNTVWTDDQIEAVVICSETVRHRDLVLAGARAGKHMFVEKPLGLGASDAYEMADAIKAAGILFQTGYFQRGRSVHLFLREQIAAGAFGTITRFRHSNCHAGSLGDWFGDDWRWMTDITQAGMGAFGDLGTHSLDIMMWLMGAVTRVTATVNTVTGRYGKCDEFGEGLLVFENGVVGSLAAGWVDIVHPISLIISGTEGHAYVCNNELFFRSTHVPRADGKSPWLQLPDAWPHAFELFLQALTGKPGISLVSAHEAADRSAVMEALYTAASNQTWMDLT